MAQSVIGALRVNLGLDSAKFSKGASAAEKRLKAMRTQFLAITAVAAAAGAALSTMALKGAQDIDKSAKAARRLGSSIGGFRALELAAGEAGVSLSSLTNDVQTIDREIASIGKSGNADRALKALGLSIDDLAGKDADEKLATIADRVKALGLSTGETTSILRDLGVRNREMVLLVGAGGDALRQARRDVEEYGLAISAVDAAAIEQANDRIGRLGLIGQYAAQRLATELVPAMGRLAEAMTNSLREGGMLRAVIDGLTSNIERLGTYVAVAAAGFGVRYVGALVVARAATFSLAGALGVLRTAIARTGVGLLVIGAAELVMWFGNLVSAAGGFSGALQRVFDVGKAVFLGVGNTAWGLMEIMAGVASSIAGSFVRAFAVIAGGWDTLINGMASAWNMLAESGLGDTLGLGTLGASNIGGKVGAVADGLMDNAVSSIQSGGKRILDAGRSVADAVKASLKVTIDAADQTSTSLDAAADSADGLGDALEAAGGGGGGSGGARGGAGALDTLKGKAEDLKEKFVEVKNVMGEAFTGLVTGAKSLQETIKGVLSKFAEMVAHKAFDTLWNGVGGKGGIGAGITGWISKLIPGFADGTSYAPGGMAMVGERGPELINLPRGSQVLNAQRTKAAMSDGADRYVEVRVIGGDLTLSDNGVIMAKVGVIANQTKNDAVSATLGRMNKTKTGWA